MWTDRILDRAFAAMPFVCVLLLCILALLPVALYLDLANKSRLIAECMADGRKEYECYGMIRGKR
jgi:hypothetical protein